MQKLRNFLVSASLLICVACSPTSEIKAPSSNYVGVPAALTAKVVVRDIEMKSIADIVESRGLWKAGFEKCDLQLDAIRKHDREMREAAKDGAEAE